jgi:putative DNA-invertase from lambdoid prophage Rac
MRSSASAHGWDAKEYVDRASAGDMTGRIAWSQLIEDARRRRIDAVMVWKLDRAFRSSLHCLRTLEAWEQAGVGFSTLTQDIDTTTATGRLLLAILSAVAEFERGLIAERVKEGMANARRKGVRIGRPRAIERPHAIGNLDAVRAAVEAGSMRKRTAARKLRVGFGTLLTLLSAQKGDPPRVA